MEEKGWSVLATYSSGLEADIVLGQLEQAGIPALRDDHSATGIFGPGFQGRPRKASPFAFLPKRSGKRARR